MLYSNIQYKLTATIHWNDYPTGQIGRSDTVVDKMITSEPSQSIIDEFVSQTYKTYIEDPKNIANQSTIKSIEATVTRIFMFDRFKKRQ